MFNETYLDLNHIIGSRQTSRGGSPVGILKGGKRSRDASKDRTGLEVPKGSGSSKDIDVTHPSEEVAAGKPLSRAASLKKSISFSKKKEERSFDEEIDEKFARAAEPLQSGEPNKILVIVRNEHLYTIFTPIPCCDLSSFSKGHICCHCGYLTRIRYVEVKEWIKRTSWLQNFWL